MKTIIEQEIMFEQFLENNDNEMWLEVFPGGDERSFKPKDWANIVKEAETVVKGLSFDRTISIEENFRTRLCILPWVASRYGWILESVDEVAENRQLLTFTK
jgi:hypothetical protein